MYLISAEEYKNAGVDFLEIRKTGEIWPSMKDSGRGLGVKNISDLVLKEIKKLTKEKIKNYKMTERETYEKFDNLSEDELNTRSNKNVYLRNDVMTAIIKHCQGEKKKRGIRAIDVFRKKLIIPDFEISKCSEHEVKSKIWTIFVNEKILEEYSVKIYEIDPYFYEHYRKKIQVDENGCEYILFRIDVYFTEYLLAVEIDEKGHTGRDLIFEEKKTKSVRKKLNCNFIRINTSRQGYDADYEASGIQKFISEFKEK